MSDKEHPEDEQGYTKVDRRAGTGDAAEPEPVAEDATEEAEAAEEEEVEAVEAPAAEEEEVEAVEAPAAEEEEVVEEAADEPELGPDDIPDYEVADAPIEDDIGEEPSEAQTLADIGVFGTLRFSVGLLIQQTWIALGIQAPGGGETQENLPEAKVAIDTIQLLVEKLDPDLDDAEKRELEGTLSNLRVNFVQRSA